MIIKLVFKLGLSKILANKWPYWGLISNGLHHWNGHQSWIGGFNFFLNTNYILEHSLNLMLFNLEQIWWDKPSQKLIPSTPFISRYKIWLQIPTVLNHSSYVRYVTYRFKCTVYSIPYTQNGAWQYKGFVLVWNEKLLARWKITLNVSTGSFF